jgi:hypothetical protein
MSSGGSTRDRFERMFPELSYHSSGGLREQGNQLNKAKVLLASLGGWLDGFVAAARIQLEAREYAEARQNQERGIGFRPDEDKD